MATYRVDSDRLQSASAAVNTSVTSIRDATRTMYANLQDLQSVWHGSAASSFSGLIEQWRAAQQQMEQSLQNIQQAMSKASTTYAQAETNAQMLFAH